MRTSTRISAKTQNIAASLHERFSRFSRQLRSMELPPGMTPERLSALSTISALEPISVTALADREKVRPATMSRMVSSLEADSYVRRLNDKSDGRGVLVAVTAKGRRFYERSQRQRLQQLAEALSELPSSQLATMQQLASALERLTNILEEPR
jgi:DNA-binding MarR family transcriptional regulator